ncbi:MAG TPA: DUF559 domain-containing protein [Acidimicrobiia bacterium]|nr:DUF559 domain-containing protein [Acidimicrobiia bacterium]
MWEEEVARYAREHHGLVDRDNAVQLGGSLHLVRHRLYTGRWDEIHPGVYYLNVTPATWRTEILASVMAAGPDAVVSHRTAAQLHGLDGVYGRPIDITVPYRESPEPESVIMHRSRRPLDATVVDAIRVTTVERTSLDLAAMFGDMALERVVASALRKKLTTVEALDAHIGLRGGRGVAGTRRLRRVLAVVAGDRSGSFAEVDLGQLIRLAPIATPIQQLQIRFPQGDNAYPDFSWPDRMRIVEVDGLEAHSTHEQLEHDLHRQNRLMQLGWEIRRFSARRVRREPQEVIEELTRFVMAPFSPRSVNAG